MNTSVANFYSGTQRRTNYLRWCIYASGQVRKRGHSRISTNKLFESPSFLGSVSLIGSMHTIEALSRQDDHRQATPRIPSYIRPTWWIIFILTNIYFCRRLHLGLIPNTFQTCHARSFPHFPLFLNSYVSVTGCSRDTLQRTKCANFLRIMSPSLRKTHFQNGSIKTKTYRNGSEIALNKK